MSLIERIDQLTPQQKERLSQKLKEQAIDLLQLPITSAKPAENGGYPLSFGQERLWFIQQLEPHSSAYNLVRATQLVGKLDVQALDESIREIIARHQVLRTVFRFDKDRPYQFIRPELVLPLKIVDLMNEPGEKRKEETLRLIQEESLSPFDLVDGPLLRTKLLALGEAEHVFLLVIHHIVADGTSIQVFIRELVQLYSAFSRGMGGTLPALPIQYVDYAHFQHLWFGTDSLDTHFRQKQERYWLDRFKGEIPVLNLPADYPRPAIQDFAGASLDFGLDTGASASLKHLASKNHTTLYVVLLAIFNIFLAKLSGQPDIVVGTPVAGRRHPAVQKLIGMFVNTLALRNFPAAEKTFADFLLEVKDNTLDAFENQEYRYEDLLEKVKVNRDTARNPLFDVMFLFKNVDYARVNIPGLTLASYDYVAATAKFDLTLSAWETGEPGNSRLLFSFEYASKIFRATTIERFSGYFRHLLGEVLPDSSLRVAEIDILHPSEREQIISAFNDTARPYPREKTIDRLFHDQVQRTPSQLAVIGYRAGTDGPERQMVQLTYEKLAEQAGQSAAHLRERGLQPGMVVGILLERTVDILVAMLAILEAGCAYLPMDPVFPQKRLDYMLADSGAEILLDRRFFEMGASAPLSNRLDLYPVPERSRGADLAYVIYTSGTTGQPKGVAIPHRAVVNFIIGITYWVDFQPRDRILSLTTVSFDIFGLETLVPLARGSTVIFGSEEMQLDPVLAWRAFTGHGITIFQTTPSRVQLFLAHDQARAGSCLASLRFLLVGGEAFPQKLLDLVRVLFTGKPGRIINLYGPTETTIWSMASDLSAAGVPLTIGRPLANTQVFILDKHLRLCPIGVPGEIYLGGDGLARGYINNPELTAERFVTSPPNPLSKIGEGENRGDQYLSRSPSGVEGPGKQSPTTHRSPLTTHLYKTGDLARFLEDGTIEFLGRLDHQVKIRGFRIELGEIENRLQTYRGIGEAVVVAREDDTGNKFLCAYYVPVQKEGAPAISITNLREYLGRTLPDYMIPAYFISLPTMPLTPNKKVDRKALPKPTGSGLPASDRFLVPKTELEKKIAEQWQKVLRVDRVGIHDNFFEMGGNSMTIIQLNNDLRTLLNREIPVVAMYRHLTIDALARYLSAGQEQNTDKSERQLQKDEALKKAKTIFKSTIQKTRGDHHVVR